MKIIFFNSCKKWGGGEKWHSEMADSLQKRSINVVGFANRNSPLFNAFKKSSIAVFPVSIHSLSFLNIFKTIKLAKLFKSEAPDIIILNLSSDVKSAGIAAKIAGIKTIIYRRGSAIPIKNSLSNRFLFKKVITDIIANTEETKETILLKNSTLFDRKKIKVIYNGIKLDSYKVDSKPLFESSNDEIIFGNLARLSKQKGQKDLIPVAQFLKDKGLIFKILIGGTGELEEELKAETKKANLSDHIIFLGFVEDVSAFLNSINIFLFPSIWEGFGFSIIEAKLFKKPIIAYNTSSNPEVIQQNIDGILVQPFNVIEFANEAYKLAIDPKKCKEMGALGNIDVQSKFLHSMSEIKLLEYLQTLN